MHDVPFDLAFGDMARPPFNASEDFLAPNQLREVWAAQAAVIGYASPLGPALLRTASPKALRPTEARHLATGLGGWPRVASGLRRGPERRRAALFAAAEGLVLADLGAGARAGAGADGSRRVLLEDARPGALSAIGGTPWALGVRSDGLWHVRPDADPVRLTERSDVRDVALVPLGEGALAVYALADAALGLAYLGPRGTVERGRLNLDQAASSVEAVSAGRQVAVAFAHGDERLGGALVGSGGTVYERAHVLHRVAGAAVQGVAVAWVERGFVAAARTEHGGEARFDFASMTRGVAAPGPWSLALGPWRLAYAGRTWVAVRVRAGARGEAAVRFARRSADGTEDDAEHAFTPTDQRALLRQRDVRELTLAVARHVRGPVAGGYRDGPGPLRPDEETVLRFPRGRPVHLRTDAAPEGVWLSLSTRPGPLPAQATSAWRALLATGLRARRAAFAFVRARLGACEVSPPEEAFVGAWRDEEGTVAVLSLREVPDTSTVAAWARALAEGDP
ncbi:MAG: hypothetical protein AAF447_06835 [Myxococcota bacterium]